MKNELENHWAKSEIEELYQKGIVSGISDTSLGLESPITRAQFASLIVRTLDIELVPYEGGFNDVGKNDWYADALQTAYNNNLLSGFDSKMSPEANITREEMAVILSNAVKSENSQADYSDFSDTENISAWAQQAVDNTVSLGLMFGMDDGSFAPKNDTKRCEAFVVIHRLLNLQN